MCYTSSIRFAIIAPKAVSSKPPSHITKTGRSGPDPQFCWLKVNSSPAASKLAIRKKYLPSLPLPPSRHHPTLLPATPPPCTPSYTSMRSTELGHRRPARSHTRGRRRGRLPYGSSSCAWRALPPETSRPSPTPTQ
jgi:hypothetical protein